MYIEQYLVLARCGMSVSCHATLNMCRACIKACVSGESKKGAILSQCKLYLYQVRDVLLPVEVMLTLLRHAVNDPTVQNSSSRTRS